MVRAADQFRSNGSSAGQSRVGQARPSPTRTTQARSGEVRSLRTLEYVLGADPAVVRGYATAAADRFAEGPMTLDARNRLLQRGERLGLRRFDANLVLAAVEQRHRQKYPAAPMATPEKDSRRFVWPTAAAAIAVQAIIVGGVWWLVG